MQKLEGYFITICHDQKSKRLVVDRASTPSVCLTRRLKCSYWLLLHVAVLLLLVPRSAPVHCCSALLRCPSVARRLPHLLSFIDSSNVLLLFLASISF